MLWAVYNVLFVAGYLCVLPWFVWRMCRRGGYRRGFMQRFGWYGAELERRIRSAPRVWVHAVSVGEMYVAMRFMRELRERDPALRFVVTTTTSTAHAIGTKELPAEDVLLYFPVDVPPVVRRVLAVVRPRALILAESEIWPNLIRLASARGIPVLLINGRVSGAAFKGYRRLRTFFAPVLRLLSLSLVQTPTDRDRLVAAGAEPERVRVVGSAKYDMARRDAAKERAVAEVLSCVGFAREAPILLGGSTWPGEEAALLTVYERLRASWPDLRLILVPRHAERRAEVESAVRAAGRNYRLRSQLAAGTNSAPPSDVLIVDTTGELAAFYAFATVIFVGKSLKAHGGQNIVEPASLGKPVIVGPHMENFAEVAEDFLKARALVMVRSDDELAEAVRGLLASQDERAAIGQRALDVVKRMTGSVRLSAERVAPFLAR
jgi:3-deoxy-D-manno-octulosonic-acid transferase